MEKKLLLDTPIPFSTDDYFYLNRGAIDSRTENVLAYQSIAFPAWDVHAALAVSDKALDVLLDRNLPAIPDFSSLMHLRDAREAFTLPAWNCVAIGIPREVIELRVSRQLPAGETPAEAPPGLELPADTEMAVSL